ncbi:GUN4 domain-containing protein [Phormidium sp. FACHB-592]|uniref:GUN4 domain-containing protein n=1 Tax=Stenomitos frigidus AS-A4 TaxID=2933935 RepID=A0ABV0KLW9_9CYAN|nr:GUN4 domain-containing protein [Phormidium sp. FACHB-592]MBD2075072.1 GUN4 domain-containing protein [Phormidium sp. FACHB-592]
MPEEPSKQPSIPDQLAELAVKVLKPGGVGVGSAYGLWLLFIEHKAAEAIASAVIGMCLSYGGNLWGEIHKGNERRFKATGAAIDGTIDHTIEQLFAKATRAEDAYLLCQALDCRDYKPEGMGARDRISIPQLQEIFVPLELDSSAIAPGLQPRDRRTIEPFQELDIWAFLRESKRQPAYRQLAIVAWGGFGKTTLLKHLAFIYGTKQHRQFKVPFLIPVLLPLRSYRSLFAQEKPPDLPALVMQHHITQLAELNPRLKKLPAKWFEDVLTNGDALVMMDGFDEIPESERPALGRWITAQMRRFDRSVFILTSRPTAYKDDFAEPLRTKLWVRPLKPSQQEAFVRQWYRCQEQLDRGGRNTPEVQREATRNADNLLNQIHNPDRPELADLAKNPLLLNLLATYHRSDPGVELPRQRAELYQDICTLQLRKRPAARGIELSLSWEDRQKVLQAVALKMMQRTLKLIPEAELVQLVAQALQMQGKSVAPEALLKQIIDVSELIVRQGLEGCEFAHLSFQEFLAAKQIKDLQQEGLLYPCLHAASIISDDRSWWRQTILLYAAQTNPTRLIQEAIRQGATDLAYACWQETQRTLDPAIEASLQALKPALQTSRYATLEDLLKTQQWREADEETYWLMLTTVGKEEGQWFDLEDLENFPCEDLRTLDQLWVKYSHGKWGFSIQRRIWQEYDSPMFDDDSRVEDWIMFCECVGWSKSGDWLYHSDLTFDLKESQKGELPGWFESPQQGGGVLLSRIRACGL